MRVKRVCHRGVCDECCAPEASKTGPKMGGGQLTGKEFMNGYKARTKGMRIRNKHRQPGTKRERIR